MHEVLIIMHVLEDQAFLTTLHDARRHPYSPQAAKHANSVQAATTKLLS
jgi:hypothetical protein